MSFFGIFKGLGGVSLKNSSDLDFFEGSRNVSTSGSESGGRGDSRSRRSSRLDFDRLKSVQSSSTSSQHYGGKDTRGGEEMPLSYIPFTSRESILCRVKLLSMDGSTFLEVLDKNAELSFMEIRREKPDYKIFFFQPDQETKVEFLISHFGKQPEASFEDHTIDFEFKIEKNRSNVKVEFLNHHQFEHLTKLFERYIEQERSSGNLEIPLSDLMKNVGPSKVEMYTVDARNWKSDHIKAWLEHVFIQANEHGKIETLHEYMERFKLLPEFKGRMYWKSRDYTVLSYEKLKFYFSKPESSEDEYLNNVFRFPHRKILLPVMKNAIERLEGNEMLFNYNFYCILRKFIAMGGLYTTDLSWTKSVLSTKRKWLWSVVDCADYLLSKLFYERSFDEIIAEKDDKFKELETRRKLDETYLDSRDDFSRWEAWKKMLVDFNENQRFDLEKVCYRLSVKNKLYKLRKQEEDCRNAYDECVRLEIDKEEEEEVEESKVEHEKKKDELNERKKKSSEKLTDFVSKRDEIQNDNTEKERFYNSETRLSYIQEYLFKRLEFEANKGMSEWAVKTVLSLLPATARELETTDIGANLSKGMFRLARTFNLTPIFSQFGFCHASVMFANLHLHWFANSFVTVQVRKTGNRYEEICCLEADCPTVLAGNVKRAYEYIIHLAEVLTCANVNLSYSFMNVFGKKEQMNCQEFTLRLLKVLDYTPYEVVVQEYVDQFVGKYSKFGNNLKPKNTLNSRWLPLENRTDGFKSKFEKLITEQQKRNKEEEDNSKDKVYFNTHDELDLFFYECLKIDRDFKMNCSGVYQLLKSFDRAFWAYGALPSEDNEIKGVCPFGRDVGEVTSEILKEEEDEGEEEEEEVVDL